MTLRNTQASYGSVAKFFHWLLFLLVVWQFVIGFFSEDVEKFLHVSGLFPLHKLIGLAVLVLIAFRLLWAVYNPKPLLLDCKPWERFLAHAMHNVLYLCLIVMSFSGWITSTAAGRAPALAGYTLPLPGIPVSKALSEQAGDVHSTVAWILLILVSLHILAALKHYFLDKDYILQRMLPGKSI